MHQQHSKRRRRSQHSAQFKVQLGDQCVNGRTSVSATAVDNGINPNLLRRWVLEHACNDPAELAPAMVLHAVRIDRPNQHAGTERF